MSQPFIGEIRVVGFNFAPLGWADCDGQIISIAENTALFSLLGTTYGGDGQTTFALPDFRGRAIAGMGNTMSIGEVVGSESVTLTPSELPAHTHQMGADNDLGGTSTSPAQGVYATLANASKSDKVYGNPGNALASSSMIQPTGGSQPHENRMPYLGIRVIIALEGIFPSRN